MTIDLSGNWQLKQSACEMAALAKVPDFIAMKLPGDVHSSLYENGIIKDPYYGKNELDVQWVGKTDWIIEREITVQKRFFSGRQFLSLEMADTFVTVLVNGAVCGTCDNMFRFWRFDVTDVLKVGTNIITLVFESAERRALKKAMELPYPIPSSVYPVYSPHRNLTRKAQCHAGWDWGPCLMAFGVYGTIQLEQTTSGFIDYLDTCVQKDDHVWNVSVTAHISALFVSSVPIVFMLKGINATGKEVTEEVHITAKLIADSPQSDANKEELSSNRLDSDALCGFPNRFTACFRVENPPLWYQVGSSPQDDDSIFKTGHVDFSRENTLYTVSVCFGSQKKNKKIAFRTLETVSKEDADGKSLFFRVNNRDVFVKGSNWIPSDALPSRQTEEKYEILLDSLVRSGQNCIRVWGGGQYEKDVFYDICDRKGILVWQDCMFSCSMYPSDNNFLYSVRQEIRHQVRRLKNHACIALWCGNNEDVGALTWYEESRKNRDRYIIDYDRLNEGVLAQEITALDPDRAWWPSSPSAGVGDYSDNWHSDSRGDMHYWSVWHDGSPFEAYRDIRPRFVSEFGYQSFPSLETVRSYASEDQQNFTSPVMEFHQRNPRGNSIILENFSRYFRFPTGFESMLYLSQVQQALAIKTAVEYWRTLRPRCMGAIIWQLNDLWPVASWSSIEYSGKWKLLHYAARDFFAPFAIVLYEKDSMLYAYALNDSSRCADAELLIRFIDFSGKTLREIPVSAFLKADSASLVWSLATDKTGFTTDSCFIHAHMKIGDAIIENTLFTAYPKLCAIERPQITYEISHSALFCFEIRLQSKAPAFYVSIDVSDIEGEFSTNLFTLNANEEKTVVFTSKKKITPAKFSKAFKITSLRDTY